jgi:hypothetical protein
MQGSSVSKFDRVFSWIAAVFLGIGGLYDGVTGAMAGNTGQAVYGLGKAICGVFFVLHALNPASLQNPRAKVRLNIILYIGFAIAIGGFLLKKGIL